MLANTAFSQTVLFVEDFNTGAPTWTINTVLGAEGLLPNEWYVSCQEEGVGAGMCGTACGPGDQTLHISSNSAVGDVGAAYAEAGGGNTTTNRRAETPDISTVGETTLSLSFDMIGFGGGSDYCELFYSNDGGGSWTSLAPTLVSACCGGPCTGAEQGLWQNNTYALPADAEGITNLRIGFVWQNVDDLVATDPSIAVDNLRITALTPEPTAEFTMMPAPPVCIDEVIRFTDASTVNPPATYDWTFDGGTPATATGPGPHDVSWPAAGMYNVTLSVTDADGTDDTVVVVEVLPPPPITATATPSDVICNGDQVILTAAGGVTYTWDGGVTNGVPFSPTATTTYTVTGEDANGCTADVSVTVTVVDCVPLIAGFEFPDPTCVGQCITITDTTSGVPTTWLWDFGGGATPNTSTEQNPEVCFDSDGEFDIQLTVEDAAGQISSTTNTITVFTSPKVTAERDTTIDLGGAAELIANDTIDDLSYWWTPDYYVDCPTCPVTYASPQFDTVYTITVTDTNGCQATDMVSVKVNFIEGIGVPTAFSPNGDGNNDVLYVKGVGITKMNFKVYNKYGEKVFETQEQRIGWDGTYLGRNENPGVFVWVLEYSFVNGSGGIQKGNTTLVR